MLVFGLWGGVLADRFNIKDLVVVAQVMQAVSAAALAVLALTDVIAAWHVFVAAFVVGLSSTLEQPGRAGIIGQLAGLGIGRFTGQRVRVTPLGVTIIEPDIPRHVRLGLPPRSHRRCQRTDATETVSGVSRG